MRLFSTDPSEPGVFAVGQQAVGIVALGQLAVGVIAIGQLARGVVAIGQVAVGVVAVGQLGFGLWRAVGMLGVGSWRTLGMLALGGRHASGLSRLPLLPGWLEEPLPSLPEETPASEILAGRVAEGWVRATVSSEQGDPRLHAEAEIDAAPVRPQLEIGLGAGHEEAMVRVHALVDDDPAGYREAVSRRLVADDAVTWSKKRPRYLAFGNNRARASTSDVAVRGFVQALLIAAWVVVVFMTVSDLPP